MATFSNASIPYKTLYSGSRAWQSHFPIGKPGLGSWKASPGSQGGRTRHPVWAPPLSSLTHSCAHIYSIPQEHLKPPQEYAPHQHPALPAVHGGLTAFAVCCLCFLPIPITFCSHVCSPLNYDKYVIYLSLPTCLLPTHTPQGGQRNSSTNAF